VRREDVKKVVDLLLVVHSDARSTGRARNGVEVVADERRSWVEINQYGVNGDMPNE
jgi:hypothetical protein